MAWMDILSNVLKGASAPAPGVGITVEHLLKMGVSQLNADKYASFLNQACAKFKINTNARICAFISQICEESGNLSSVNENLGYTTKNMMTVWPSRFPTAESTMQFVGHPDLLANAVYGNRLGNSEPGDGYKYRGRGFIQLTFKGNYQASSKGLGVDLVSNPDLVSTPQYAALTAAEYWARNGCNEMADPDNLDAVVKVTKKINGGYINLDTRKAYWNKAKLVFADLK
jgi:putative chitinase